MTHSARVWPGFLNTCFFLKASSWMKKKNMKIVDLNYPKTWRQFQFASRQMAVAMISLESVHTRREICIFNIKPFGGPLFPIGLYRGRGSFTQNAKGKYSQRRREIEENGPAHVDVLGKKNLCCCCCLAYLCWVSDGYGRYHANAYGFLFRQCSFSLSSCFV